MVNTVKSRMCRALACGAAAALLAGTTPALSAGEAVSTSAGISYNSHFISYGADVWAGGNDFFGDRSTTFVWADAVWKINDALALNLGVWSDNNDNVASPLGGNIQEIDVYAGLFYTIGNATFGAMYQEWNYAADEERIIDLTLAFNDAEWWSGFALNPKFTWHFRVDGNGGQQEGSVVQLAIGPSFPITESISLTIPAGVAFFIDDDFQGGAADGYGFSFIGASLGVPLSFIPDTYGAWSVNFDLIQYFTDSAAIPGNIEDSFLTSSVGLKVAY